VLKLTYWEKNPEKDKMVQKEVMKNRSVLEAGLANGILGQYFLNTALGM
jgi:hypothetical protein